MKKKILAASLAVAVAVCALPACVSAEEEVPEITVWGVG